MEGEVLRTLEMCVHHGCSAEERREAEARLAGWENEGGFWIALVWPCERVAIAGEVLCSDAARLLGAVVAKNAVARAVQRDRRKEGVRWSSSDPAEKEVLERACAHGALLESNDAVATQLALLLATICRAEARSEDDSLGAAPKIMASLAAFATGVSAGDARSPNLAALAAEARPWVATSGAALAAAARVPGVVAVRRALRCLKHCVRSCVDEARELETTPSAAVLSAFAANKAARPSSSAEIEDEYHGGGVIVVSSLAVREQVFIRARETLNKAQTKRERRMSALAASAAMLSTVASRAWIATAREVASLHHREDVDPQEERRRKRIEDETLVACRWLRCLEALVSGTRSLAEVARRYSSLAATRPPEGGGGTTTAAAAAVPTLLSSPEAVLLPALGGTSAPLVEALADVARSAGDAKLARLASDTLRALVEARCVAESAATTAAMTIASTFVDDEAFSRRLDRAPERAVAAMRCLGKLALEDYDDDGGGGGSSRGRSNISEEDAMAADESHHHHHHHYRDPMDMLCDSATSLEISESSRRRTSSGGGEAAGGRAEIEAIDPVDQRAAPALIETVLNETGFVEALIKRYFALSPAELGACASGESERLYARECRAVGSSASASWNASASLFASCSSRRLTREAPSLADEDAVEDPWNDARRLVEEARPTAEALVVSLCVRAPNIVSRAVLGACEAHFEADNVVVIDACYRAIGLVAPLLPSRGERALVNFGDLWRSRLEPALSSAPPRVAADARVADAILRARCLWLVSRFRRAIFDETLATDDGRATTAPVEVSLLASVLPAILHHANPAAFPDARLALSAIDAHCSILETTVERHRAGSLYARRLARENARREEEARRDEEDGVAFFAPKDAATTLSEGNGARALTTVWRAIAMVRAACASIAGRAVAVAREARTPEGALRCLQCVALCVEAASLEDFSGPRRDDIDDAALGELVAALGAVVANELVPLVWAFAARSCHQDDDDAGRYAASKIRAAVLCLSANALKAARRRATPAAVDPLRRAAVALVRAVADLDGDQTPLLDDAFALWLEALRATPPGADETLDAEFDLVFARYVSSPSAFVAVGPGLSLVDASLRLAPAATTAPPADTLDAHALAALDEALTAPFLAIVQGYLLRAGGRDSGLVAASSALALCGISKLDALEIRVEDDFYQSYAARSENLPDDCPNLEVEVAAVLAAFVVAELVLQTAGRQALVSCEPLKRAVRLASVFPADCQPTAAPLVDGVLRPTAGPRVNARYESRFVDARVTLVSRAILQARGDAFLACGVAAAANDQDDDDASDLVRTALANIFELAARRTLDDLAVVASSRGAAPPPRRVVAASLAAAAALADDRSANAAWASLPAILRLWARALFELRRAADRCPPIDLARRRMHDALREWKLPLSETEYDEPDPTVDSPQVLDSIATAARRLQRDDIIHTASLVDAAKHALSRAAPTRGGPQAIQAAADQVNPPDLRNILVQLLS